MTRTQQKVLDAIRKATTRGMSNYALAYVDLDTAYNTIRRTTRELQVLGLVGFTKRGREKVFIAYAPSEQVQQSISPASESEYVPGL